MTGMGGALRGHRPPSHFRMLAVLFSFREGDEGTGPVPNDLHTRHHSNHKVTERKSSRTLKALKTPRHYLTSSISLAMLSISKTQTTAKTLPSHPKDRSPDKYKSNNSKKEITKGKI